MLPFFRKIRWRFARDNQFLKYSRYAVGEIVLVVIGILIALQINNWNEARKLNMELLAGLHKLRGEIQTNLKILEDLNTYINDGDESTFLVDQFLRDELKEIDTIQLANALVNLGVFAIFNPNDAAYQNLVNTGKIELINNDDLLTHLGEIYQTNDWNQTVVNSLVIGAYEEYQNRLHAHSTSPYIRSNYQETFIQDYKGISDTTPSLGKAFKISEMAPALLFDWMALKQDDQLKTHVQQILTYRVLQLHGHRIKEISMNKALAEIERKIGERES